jgi:hypothetical protein
MALVPVAFLGGEMDGEAGSGWLGSRIPLYEVKQPADGRRRVRRPGSASSTEALALDPEELPEAGLEDSERSRPWIVEG